MNDLISRRALLTEYDRVHIGEPGKARKLIEDAPAVREWIPVTEKLPEDNQTVLCYKADRGVRMGKPLNATYADGVAAFVDCGWGIMRLVQPIGCRCLNRRRRGEMMRRFIQSIMAELEVLREGFNDWLEWQDAKEWAKYYHPGWVEIAKKARTRTTRKVYRDRILRAYREGNYG